MNNKYQLLLESLNEHEIKTPEDLLEYMSDIKYGWKNKEGKFGFNYSDYDHGKHTEHKHGDFYNEYKLQSPQEVMKSRYGVCWDQTELERFFFKKMDIEHKTIFIVKPTQNSSSHTFLIYLKDKEVYWFENAYGDYKGIHGPFKNNNEIIKLVNKYMTADDIKDKKETTNKYEFSYYTQPKYGISCHDFYVHVGFKSYVE